MVPSFAFRETSWSKIRPGFTSTRISLQVSCAFYYSENSARLNGEWDGRFALDHIKFLQQWRTRCRNISLWHFYHKSIRIQNRNRNVTWSFYAKMIQFLGQHRTGSSVMSCTQCFSSRDSSLVTEKIMKTHVSIDGGPYWHIGLFMTNISLS